MGIKDFLRRHRGKLRVRELSPPTKLQQVAEELRELGDRRLHSPKKNTSHELEELSRRIREIALTNAWEILAHEEIELRDAVLSLESDCDDGLATSRKAVQNLLNHIKLTSKKLPFHTLIRLFLRNYNPDNELTKQIASFISTNIGQLGSKPTIHAHNEFHLFDVTRGAKTIAQTILEAHDISSNQSSVANTVWPIFDRAYIKFDARNTGIGDFVFCEACKLVQNRLQNNPAVEDVHLLTEWAKLNDGDHTPNSISFTCRPNLAESLLLPWISHQNVPPRQVKQKIFDYVNVHFKDPRLFGDPRLASANRWRKVSVDAKKVFMRWLHHHSVTLFFDATDKIVDANIVATRQWNPRRAFWEEKIYNDEIIDCTMAFAKAGQDLLRNATKHHFDHLYNASSDQAVLLLKVRLRSETSLGTLVVADWNYNGSMRIWRETNPNAPTVSYETHDGLYVTREINGKSLRAPADETIRHVRGWQIRTDRIMLELSRKPRLRYASV